MQRRQVVGAALLSAMLLSAGLGAFATGYCLGRKNGSARDGLTKLALSGATMFPQMEVFETPYVSAERSAVCFLDEASTSIRGLAVWGGGAHMPLEDMIRTVRQVARHLGLDPDLALVPILEICAVESDFGLIVKQKSGPALSPWQIEPGTWKYMLTRLQQQDPVRHRLLQELYRPERDQAWNRTRNIPYACGMSMLFIETVFPNGFKKLDTLSARARMWKRWYNTPKGSGTIERYKRKSRQLVWNRAALMGIKICRG